MCHDILFCFAFVFFVFGNGLSGFFHMLFFFFCRCLDGWLDGWSGGVVFGFGSVACGVSRRVIREGA